MLQGLPAQRFTARPTSTRRDSAGDGLVLLHAAIQRCQLEHPRAALIAELLKSLPAGSLWSLRPGAELTR